MGAKAFPDGFRYEVKESFSVSSIEVNFDPERTKSVQLLRLITAALYLLSEGPGSVTMTDASGTTCDDGEAFPMERPRAGSLPACDLMATDEESRNLIRSYIRATDPDERHEAKLALGDRVLELIGLTK